MRITLRGYEVMFKNDEGKWQSLGISPTLTTARSKWLSLVGSVKLKFKPRFNRAA